MTPLCWITNFYPRPPRGGRRILILTLRLLSQFLSTPSARRATHSDSYPASALPISIHALREEGDLDLSATTEELLLFLSTPSARRATRGDMVYITRAVFLSTPSARRATQQRIGCRGDDQNFYPRPPRGGRLFFVRPSLLKTLFLSTPSARRATLNCHVLYLLPKISIHALREEGDSKNREKTLCFCLIIHLPAQIAKRCL